MITLKKQKRKIPTYIPKKANELPMFFENKPYQGASGRLYPIPYSDGISDEKADVEYEVYTLENEYIKTDLLPQLGGKLLRGYDKAGKHDFIYYNEVVKPALVGLAGPWISGGIEFNWPQHHRPTTFSPVEAVAEENADGGKTVWMGEIEPFHAMKGMVGITLDEGRSYIKARVRVYNRTAQPQLFMWWANLAVPVNENYRTVFPPDCEWVNDHDRRAVLSWPIAKGIYKTARPYDFGEGTDLSHYSAVKVPSSYLISQGQSDMDFIAGYDAGIQKGIATVANHHLSPGKKMWHWGIGDFGDMWCSNLTDENGPYIELMTGVFTDNQPDFTWIAPYETKEFEQYWYPIRGIGEIKNASVDGAINFENRGAKLFLGLNVTGKFKGATVKITHGSQVVFEEKTDLAPEDIYTKEIFFDGDFQKLRAALYDASGMELVAYQPYRRGQKEPIPVREPIRRPAELATVEELYINGYHLEQYKQHNYKPQAYYLEGLRRDPGDIRCNTSMARLALKNGEFESCVAYCDKAIERLTCRNQHPTDTEAFYLKGLALEYLERWDEAYGILYRAAWNYLHRSAALFELATIDCRRGEWAAALEKIRESLEMNSKNLEALNLRTAILRKLGHPDGERYAKAGAEEDPLDLLALLEYSRFTDQAERIAEFAQKPENLLHAARSYMKAGMNEDALYALSFAKDVYPLVEYYKAYLSVQGAMEAAERSATGYCFPSHLEDIAVLKNALGGANANYYLGCLYYDRFRYEEAAECWQRCVEKDAGHGKAWRNLALYWFDQKADGVKARTCLEKALECRADPRLLLEYQQLLKNTGCPVEERLAVYDCYPALLAERDDCYLDQLTLVSQTGDHKKAIEMAKARRFHIYEGGEGKLTKQHAWMHVLYGNQLMAEGKPEMAEQTYLAGIHMPRSYGEAKTFFNQEAHIHYFLGRLLEKSGRDAAEAYEEAAVYKAAVSEISLFRALALQKLGRHEEAGAVLDEMLAAAEDSIRNCDLRSYYGVGSPSPMPFENNAEKNNLKSGYLLSAFALLGKGRAEEADAAIEKAAELEPYDYTVYLYREIRKVI